MHITQKHSFEGFKTLKNMYKIYCLCRSIIVEILLTIVQHKEEQEFVYKTNFSVCGTRKSWILKEEVAKKFHF